MQGEEPSWLATGGHYERDRAGLAALAAELQAWLDGGRPEAPSFIHDPQVCASGGVLFFVFRHGGGKLMGAAVLGILP